MPLPEDHGLHGDRRPKVRRYRSRLLDLGARLRAFRAEYGLTQDEVASVVGASDRTTVAQWELGVTVPDGARRQRLVDLLAGRLWPELRAAMTEGDGLPARWARAVRWYRRASRERRPRSTHGVIVAALLDELRRVESVAGLRERYRDDDGSWVRGVAAALLSAPLPGADLQRVEEVAYGLRWVEVTCGIEVDLSHSLIRQVLVALLE